MPKINKGQLIRCNMNKKRGATMEVFSNFIFKSQTLKGVMSL